MEGGRARLRIGQKITSHFEGMQQRQWNFQQQKTTIMEFYFFFLKDHFHLFVVICNIVEKGVKCKTLFLKKKKFIFILA